MGRLDSTFFENDGPSLPLRRHWAIAWLMAAARRAWPVAR